MKNDLVSVIITTYKREPIMVKRAIDSVLNQTHRNLELIIVDDSPDTFSKREQVEKMVNSFSDSRIKYIKHKKNKGACAARNTGISVVKGDYIAFLDDDDEWLPEKLELQLQKFSDEKVGLVYCDSYTIKINNDNEIISKTVRANRVSGMVFEKLLEDNFVGSTSFVLIRRKAIDYCGNFNIELKSAQDYDLWLRISNKFKVDYVGVPLVKYYIHQGERISENIDNRIQGLEKIIELYLDYIKRNPKIYSKRILSIVPYYAVKFGYAFAFKNWFKAVRAYPYHKNAFNSFIRIILYKFRYMK